MLSTTALPNQHIDVREVNEAFEEVEGCFQFTKTLIVYQNGRDLHHAVSTARYSSPSEIRTEHFINDILIPFSAYNPPFSSEFTRVSNPSLHDYFVKRPRLISYDRICQRSQPTSIADSVLREVETCELLKRHPHPNIVPYFGCQVSDNRITGVCFTKYQYTLMQRVNPLKLMKRKLRSAHHEKEDYSRILGGIESGIKHLHSLGLIHNDINPSNIMLDGEEAIIIDFDSCRRQGESLENVGRTYEWYDEKVQVSLPQNDLDALEEIRIWLGDDSKAFQFDE